MNAVAYDISAACSGFIFALNTAQAFFQAGIYRTALVIGCDVLSKIVDWEDRSTCVLFGDGAEGPRWSAGKRGRLFQMVMGSDGGRAASMVCPSRTNDNFLTGRKPEVGYTSMEGQEIFRFGGEEGAGVCGGAFGEERGGPGRRSSTLSSTRPTTASWRPSPRG